MQRLHERCDEGLQRALTTSSNVELEELESILDIAIDRIIELLNAHQWVAAGRLANTTYQQINRLEQAQRELIYRSVALGDMTVSEATDCAEALRWLTRVSRHIARICFYLQQADGSAVRGSERSAPPGNLSR
jgi:phosphate:Na+ symporter